MKFRPVHWVIAAVVIASFPSYWWFRWHQQVGYTNGAFFAVLGIIGLYAIVGHGLPTSTWGKVIHWATSTALSAAPATYWWWRYQAQPGFWNGVVTVAFALGSVFVFVMFEFSVRRGKGVDAGSQSKFSQAA